MPTRRGIIGNPVAKSPLLRKGGAHRRTRSGERQRQRVDVETALELWREEERIDFDSDATFLLVDHKVSTHTETQRRGGGEV